MPTSIPVDPSALRADVRTKYRDVALRPHGEFHFHTGRPLAALLGYPAELVDALPDQAVEAFAGVGNPHAVRPLRPGERVVDLGSGGGFDCVVAAHAVGPDGHVIGVDMTPEMLTRSRAVTHALDLAHVEFREGLLEALPVDDGWADVVISNGVVNLCADKATVFAEAHRVLRDGGTLAFADIVNGKPVPEAAVCEIDLWTGCIAGGLPLDAWRVHLEDAGFTDVRVGVGIDAFGGSRGERNARAYDVFAHVFVATKPHRNGPRDAGLLGCGDGLASWFREQLVTAATGEEFPVVVRDPAALVELPALARLLGHTVLSVDPSDRATIITIRKEAP